MYFVKRWTSNMDIKENIISVKDRMARAAIKTGRNLEDITLVAVTKTVIPARIDEAIESGIRHIGENRVQEIRSKYPYIKNRVKWHLIGSLQTNKVKYIIDKVDMIHSLDRLSLAKEIDKRASMNGIVLPVLIQINVSKESTKSGIYIEELDDFLDQIQQFENIRVKGLMTIAPLLDNAEKTRPYFAKLKEIYEDIKLRQYSNVTMEYLSMGMTNDFEIAIEEGANIVRIGRAIFGER